MDSAPPHHDEHPPEDTPSEDARRSRRILARALLFSIVAHASPLLFTLHFAPSFDPIDLDTEWFGEFEELQAVGHGNASREVQFNAQQPPEEPNQEEEVEPEPPEEEPEAPEEPIKEEEPKEEEPKEEVVKPPEEEPPKLAALDPNTPKPRELEPTTPPVDELEEPVKKEEKSDEPVDPPRKREPSPSSAESLPGLEFSGPSNLPVLKNYAPGNARMTALIRLDVVRDTPYHDPTRKLMAAIPDYRIILDGSDTDPVRDFDTIFTASANPQYLQETFLVVKHSLGTAQLKRQLDERFPEAPAWGTYAGVQIRPIVPESSVYQDPRKILISDDSTALVARPEWLTQLTDNQSADASIRPAFEGDTPPKFTMLQSFEHIANAAPDDTMLLASFQGLRFMVPGYGKLPRTETVRVSITTPENPRVTIDLQFETPDEATRFANECPTMQKKLVGVIPGARLMKLDSYINRLTCTSSDTYVTVKGTYTQKEFLRAINLATPFLPKPPSLEDLPRPPERAPVAPAEMASDMGSPDAGSPPPSQIGDMGTPEDLSPSINASPSQPTTQPPVGKDMSSPSPTDARDALARPDAESAAPLNSPAPLDGP